MSTLEMQVMQSINGLSDDKLLFIIEMVDKFMKPQTLSSVDIKNRIGVFANEELYAPDYDLDEANEEIAALFGV